MNEKKDNRYIALLILDTLVGFVLWLVLIVLRAAGFTDMHWAVVLSGLVWIIWLLQGLTGTVALIVRQYAKLKRWHRRRKIDRRIIRQAKATGVWDKTNCLGGRALELAVWERAKLKRQPGETDKDLRRRYMVESIKKSINK